MADPLVRQLIGVYDADGTVWGELRYVVGVRLGRTHCSLCDITHGSLRERPAWKACRAGLPVPFEAFHRNDQPDAVRALLDGRYPAVVADTDGGLVLLLGSTELDACASSPEALVAALEAAVDRRSLRWS